MFKKTTLSLSLLALIAFKAKAQNGTTFQVEELVRAERPLPEKNYDIILQRLIRMDDGLQDGVFPEASSYKIVAKSKVENDLVTYDLNSFFRGMHAAYSDHRPFTLSPDIMWLVISQGFAHHVKNNKEELRSMFVKSAGKTILTVRHDSIKLSDPNSPWEEVFPLFTKQIAGYTGRELTDVLTADFSTTTTTTKVASQITLMNAMDAYFDYRMISGCGIPQITLEGTTRDWERVLAKTETLRKYKLNWWVDEMIPVLKQFVAASQGKVNKSFWQGMFKYHIANVKYLPPTIIDGWIVKFFPYNDKGQRNDLKTIVRTVGGKDHLPNEIVKVDLEFFSPADGQVPLELWAGFVGLDQDSKTMGLKPRIGWMIRKRGQFRQSVLNRLKYQNEYMNAIVVVDEVPPEVMQIGPIKKLQLFFKQDVLIPDELAKVDIKELYISGKITQARKDELAKLFPGSKLTFVEKDYPIRGNFSVW